MQTLVVRNWLIQYYQEFLSNSRLSDSFISFLRWVSLSVVDCFCHLRLKYFNSEGQDFSSTPLCSGLLVLSCLPSTFFSSVLSNFYRSTAFLTMFTTLSSLLASLISVLRIFVWKLCTAWFENTSFSGTLNLKKSVIMPFPDKLSKISHVGGS